MSNGNLSEKMGWLATTVTAIGTAILIHLGLKKK